MVLTVIKSFVSPSKIVILIFSSALLFLSDVNSAVTNCYTCNDCKSPTNTTSTLCNSTTGEEFCFIGLKNNDLYDQGCSSSLNFDKKIYKSNGKCQFDKCNSMSLSCLSCSNCDRPATKTKAICTVNQDSCYVGIQLFGAKIDQGCFSVGESIAQYSSSGVCKTDSCNEMKNVCYFCYQCQVPTMLQKIICTLPDSMCYVGIGKNGNYDQGCRSSSVLAESYDAYWECDTHTCNYPSLVCYHCEACKRPTTTNKTVCQFGKHDSCYIRLRKDGLYEQGCASKTSYSMKTVDNSIATIQCFENNCNKANLSCYECKNCNYTEINKQVKICTGVNETSCYTGLNYDGTYDQGCSVQNTVHLLEMYKFNSNCENSLCNISTSIINRRFSIYYFFYLFLISYFIIF